MRLIDADALIETMRENAEGNEGWYGDTWAFMRDVENAPTIDAVPVIRCKDCKWFDKQRCVCHNPRYGDGYANYQPPNTNDEYWCADGERKNND